MTRELARSSASAGDTSWRQNHRKGVDAAEQYPYGYTYLAKKKAQGLKPRSLLGLNGPTKVGP
jgi:hypothetical protein